MRAAARTALAWGLAAAVSVWAAGVGGQDERSTVEAAPSLEPWDGLGGGEPEAAGEEVDGVPADGSVSAGSGGEGIGSDGSGARTAGNRSGSGALLDGWTGAADTGIEVRDEAGERDGISRAAVPDSELARPALPGSGDAQALTAPAPAAPAAPEAAEEPGPVTPSGAGRQGTAPALPGPAPSPPVAEAVRPRGSLWGELDARAERAAGETAAAFVADMAREGCPRDLLGLLLGRAVGERDALSALALERQILVLCRKRQEVVAAVLEQEASLRDLVRSGGTEERGSVASAPEDWAAAIEAVPHLGLPEAEDEPAGAAPVEVDAAVPAEEEAAGPVTAVAYRWFTLTGSGGDLRAGVTDGTGVWFVTVGDELPGDAWVAGISVDPPAVRLAGAVVGALPWGTPP